MLSASSITKARVVVQALRLLSAERRWLGGPGSGNFGHSGRPGEVGGSGEGGAAPTPLTHPEAVLGEPSGVPGYKAYIAKHGEHFQAAPLPDDVERGRPKECYKNASLLVLQREDLDYAEGFATTTRLPGLVFMHAWAVDKSGKVVDPTWDRPEGGKYFGVKYDRKTYLAHLFKAKMYGVIAGDKKIAREAIDTDGKRMRGLGGPGSGNFGHAGRPGEVGGSDSAGSGWSDAEIDAKITDIREEQESLDSDSINASERGNDQKAEAYGRAFAAHEAIATILVNQKKMNADPTLHADSKFLYDLDADVPGGIAAAVQVSLKEGQLHLDWAGSLRKGAGHALIQKAITWGKSRGATELHGTAKWDSFKFYASKYGAKAVGRPNPINSSQEFIAHLGGPGSGNFGHAGRPGEVGGSAEGSASSGDSYGQSAPHDASLLEVRRVQDTFMREAALIGRKTGDEGLKEDVARLEHTDDLEDATESLRGQVKQHIVDQYSGVDALQMGATQARLDLWAETSGDHDGRATLMQHAIREEFGVKDAEVGHLDLAIQVPAEDHGDVEKTIALDRTYSRAEYEQTQKYFKDNGITHVTVFRGHYFAPDVTNLSAPTRPVEGIQDVVMQPASSWSTSFKTATNYANDADPENGAVFVARVPVSRVLSTCVTGRGCLSESEVILLGGKIRVNLLHAENAKRLPVDTTGLAKFDKLMKVTRKHLSAWDDMLNIDADIKNADWPKRTPDKMSDLGVEPKHLGGPGSGNFGHSGRPGEVGGSGPGGAGSSVISQPSSAYPKSTSHQDTEAMYSDGKGNYTPERQALHEAIVQKYLAGVKPVAHPVATVLGGGPASGKSTVVQDTGIGQVNTVHVDVDQIRTQLPEYREGLAAGDKNVSGLTHEESSHISKVLVKRAVEQKMNVLLDGTGDSSIEKLGGKVAGMRAGGHEVVGVYVNTPTEVAIQRSNERGKLTGRYVPETFLRETHRQVSNTFVQAVHQGLFDRFELHDTTDGRKLVASGKKDKLTIHDEKLWYAFQAKGHK